MLSMRLLPCCKWRIFSCSRSFRSSYGGLDAFFSFATDGRCLRFLLPQRALPLPHLMLYPSMCNFLVGPPHPRITCPPWVAFLTFFVLRFSCRPFSPPLKSDFPLLEHNTYVLFAASFFHRIFLRIDHVSLFLEQAVRLFLVQTWATPTISQPFLYRRLLRTLVLFSGALRRTSPPPRRFGFFCYALPSAMKCNSALWCFEFFFFFCALATFFFLSSL